PNAPMGQRPGARSPTSPLTTALDANGDDTIDAWELENASALLRKLDRNGDGKLTPDELLPAPRENGGIGAPGGQPPRRPRQPIDQ
ncbi:MAG TPA: hypothetical protein VNM37_17800, partial [Candidatus Dormibacteraeota bacterium]|nr:hypothetical protein [Candidatus Dormibacteraeota bacterium]